MMNRESSAERVGEMREDAEKVSTWMVLFGAVLVVMHLLDISPKEVDALGAKIILKDPVILRGAVAVIFLHNFHGYVLYMRIYSAYRSLNESDRQIARSTFRKYRKPKRSVRATKRMARLELGAWALAYAPYALTFVSLFVAALILSVIDVVRFVEYCYVHTAAGQFVQDQF